MQHRFCSGVLGGSCCLCNVPPVFRISRLSASPKHRPLELQAVIECDRAGAPLYHLRKFPSSRISKSLDPFAPVETGSIISPGGGDNVFRMQCSRCNCRHRSCGIHSPSPDKRAVGAVELASLVLFDLIPMGPHGTSDCPQ